MATGDVKMGLLVSVLRFIVGFLSFLIIFASVAIGLFASWDGHVIGGIMIGVGGLLASAILFGVIALLFQIRDHLAALQKYAEEGSLGVIKPDESEHIEPSLKR